MMFFQEQRIAINEFYFVIKSHCHVINAFQQKCFGETAPNVSTVTLLVQFRYTGSVADRNRSGRAAIVKTNVADVETTLQRSPLKRPSVYITSLRNSILAEIDKRYASLQHDGATCHTLRDSMEVLTGFLNDREISKGLWPPRLPDLSIQDFFFGNISKISPSGIIFIWLMNLRVTSFIQYRTLILTLFVKFQLIW
ncbi:DUF4817 domain-containing protein [Trichonephila clavipes]|nr:DUF4817 domain-containing protein [Trichonephila clavipes]